MVFTWLPLSAKALTFCTSTRRPTSVSRPIQCTVGPALMSRGSWCIVTTCVVASVEGFLWQVLCWSDLPLWNLNAHNFANLSPPEWLRMTWNGQFCLIRNFSHQMINSRGWGSKWLNANCEHKTTKWKSPNLPTTNDHFWGGGGKWPNANCEHQTTK